MDTFSSRRNFLKNTSRFVSLTFAANTGVYLIGSAFKELDGSLTAGAKTWQSAGCPASVDYNECWVCGIYEGNTCYQPGASCEMGYGVWYSWCEVLGYWTPSGGNCLVCQ